MNTIMPLLDSILLFQLPQPYQLSPSENQTLQASWYRHRVFANRHFKLANQQSHFLRAAGHRTLGLIESCPLIGLIVAKFEKRVATQVLTHKLFEAAKSNNLNILQDVLEKQAPLDPSYYTDHLSPLHIAAQNGHVEAARRLIENGALIDATTLSEQKTPLDLAIASGHLDMVCLFIEKEAQLTSGPSGTPPLQRAVSLLLSSEKREDLATRLEIVKALALASPQKVCQKVAMDVAARAQHAYAKHIFNHLKGMIDRTAIDSILTARGIVWDS